MEQVATSYSAAVDYEVEVCLLPVLTAFFQFEQQATTNLFYKPGQSAAQTPVSLNTIYGHDTLTKSMCKTSITIENAVLYH
jgi:hypothetical protein